MVKFYDKYSTLSETFDGAALLIRNLPGQIQKNDHPQERRD